MSCVSRLAPFISSGKVRVAALQFATTAQIGVYFADNGTNAEQVLSELDSIKHWGLGRLTDSNLSHALELARTRLKFREPGHPSIRHLVVLTDGDVGQEVMQPDKLAQEAVKTELTQHWSDRSPGPACGGFPCTTRWSIESIGAAVPRASAVLDAIASHLPGNRGRVPNTKDEAAISASTDAIVSSISTAVEFVDTCRCQANAVGTVAAVAP